MTEREGTTAFDRAFDRYWDNDDVRLLVAWRFTSTVGRVPLAGKLLVALAKICSSFEPVRKYVERKTEEKFEQVMRSVYVDLMRRTN